MYVRAFQVIDDTVGRTLVSASTVQAVVKSELGEDSTSTVVSDWPR
jgi:hypothetical protein